MYSHKPLPTFILPERHSVASLMFSVKTGMIGTPAAMATVAKPCLQIS